MDGLIHVSELSWKHVDHPGSVVAVGDEVDVQVLDVDMSRERISLSLKATQQDPWQEFASTHEVGQLVYGRVTKLVQFGAFVQVGDGIEGLVHISEMSTHHVDSPDQVVTPGEELWVKIIDLDLARRRISLSIKQAAEGGELAEEYREHFEVDEHGNWTAGDTDAEREAAWSEYYGEDGPRPRAASRGRRGSRASSSTMPAPRSVESSPPPTTSRSDIGMLLVALTGGMGAGKSAVSSRLAHAAPSSSTPTASCASSSAGRAPAHRAGGALRRADHPRRRRARSGRLAAIAFKDDESVAALNAIMHPAVRAEIRRQIDAESDTDRVVVLDTPLMTETVARVSSSPRSSWWTRRSRSPSSGSSPSVACRRRTRWPGSASRSRARARRRRRHRHRQRWRRRQLDVDVDELWARLQDLRDAGSPRSLPDDATIFIAQSFC